MWMYGADLPEYQGRVAEGHREGTCLELAPYVSDCPCCTVHPPAPLPSETDQSETQKMSWKQEASVTVLNILTSLTLFNVVPFSGIRFV